MAVRIRPETGQDGLENRPFTPTAPGYGGNRATRIDPAREVGNIRMTAGMILLGVPASLK
jgi:hypothetical protein